ncbi:MAG: 3'-5' exonuclease, partial [Patescibacteria group bacterium]
GYFQMWISTFHSFCDRILRDNATSIGLSPNFHLMSHAESVLFLRKNLFLLKLKYFRPLGNPNKFIESLLLHFSRLKDEHITPDDYKKYKPTEEREKSKELVEAYHAYQILKEKEGMFDFGDLIYYTILLLQKRKDIKKKLQSQFKYVLVDEFQDTNIAQYILLKLLCPPKQKPNLTIVGDDSQAIYKFRGASVSNILTFMKDYPSAKEITLRTNYRSSQSILDLSYRLIQHNNPDTLETQLGISKKLESSRPSSDNEPFFYVSQTIEDEVRFVVKKINALKKSLNYTYSDFAILVRANTHIDPFIRTLSQEGIPYQLPGPGMLFKQPEAKDLIAFIQFLANVEDSASFYRVLSMDILELDPVDISQLLSFARKSNLPLFQAIVVLLEPTLTDNLIYQKYLPKIKKETRDQLAILLKMIRRYLGLLKRETAGQLLYYFLEDTGYLKKISRYNSVKDEKVALTINKLFQRLKSFELHHEDASVFAVADYLTMSMELGESPLAPEIDRAEYDAVHVLTLHSAKGLEFPVVFMVNLVEGRFPTIERSEKIPIPTALIKETLPTQDPHVLEERRLFYVGMTRAKDFLYFTASEYYGDGKRIRKLSRFIVEAFGEKYVKRKVFIAQDTKKQLSIFEYKKKKDSIKPQKVTPTVISFSQIQTYELCPLRYKYQYALRIPAAPNAAASFGSTIHNALERYYDEFRKDKSVGLERLLQLYQANWIPIGYTSKPHEKKMKLEGIEMLTRFYKTFHDKRTSVLDLERPFKIKIASDVFITGKIDRVDEGSKKGIEIIDYKTGKKPSLKELEKSLQLSIYLLAATDKGLYKKPAHKITLTFYYLQDSEKVSMKKPPEDLQKTKGKIYDVVEKIKAKRFEARVGPWCNFCSYKIICEAWQ